MKRPLDPALLAAAGFAAGCVVSPWLEPVPPAASAILGMLSFSLRSRTSMRLLGWAAVAVFLSGAYWLRPASEVGFWDLGRPVEVVVEVPDYWTENDGEWFARGRLRRLRQGRRVAVLSLPVGITVSSSTSPPATRRYRARGTLSAPRSFSNDPELEGGGWRLRVKSLRFLTPLETTSGVGDSHRRAGDIVRRRIQRQLTLLPESSPGRGMVEALVLGQRGRFPESWLRALRRLGLAHVLAVSGLHVGLLAALVWFSARSLPVMPRVLLAIASVWLYATVVGDRPSVRRAALMASLALTTRLLQRPHSTSSALGLAVLGLLLLWPSLILDIAFQLSVGATAGILFLAPLLLRWWGHPTQWWMRGLAVSCAAQLATLPLTVTSFSRLPLLAPLLNLLIVPWTSVALALCLLWSMAGLLPGVLLVPGVGSASSLLLDAVAAPFALVSLLRPSPLTSLSLTPGFAEALALTGGLLLLLRGGWWSVASIASGLFVLVLATSGVSRPGGTEIVMFDVGQGDSVLLKDGGRGVLVDGGGWRGGDFGGRILRPALARQGIHRLDAVIVTHPDVDHCRGIADLSGAIPIAELWMGSGWLQAPCTRELHAALPTRTRLLWRGDSLRWRDWRLSIVHPPPGASGSRNQRSLVIRAEAHGHSILLTGDIDSEVEKELLRSGAIVEAEILKVAHHGSRSSTSADFLAAVRPRWALLSAGSRNPYGHPAVEVLGRLHDARIAILRTDLHGMVRIALRPNAPLEIMVQGVPRHSSAAARLVRVIDPRLSFRR